MINAFFDASEFFINFPDQVPDAFENKSFQIQFFVQDNSDQFGDYTGLLKESPSWLSLQQNDQKNFTLRGLPPEHSVGDYIIIIEVVHPNGLSVQTLKFNLKVNNQNQSRLDLLGSKILPVKKGLLLNELKEPGFFAQNSFGEEITSDVRVSFPEEVVEGKILFLILLMILLEKEFFWVTRISFCWFCKTNKRSNSVNVSRA